MQRGPKVVPTALKLLNGNPGGRPLNKNEVKPDLELPDPPDHLSEYGKAEWNRLGPQLLRLGLMSALDNSAFALFCQYWGRHVWAEKEIAQAAIAWAI